ncbi:MULTISPECIES: ABC transporter ATP-binding protein [Atopobiaceae]|uniref:ABC transporter ATP-binding protein n=1 Tax=Atopobiaceae TaxID=1643824 RepID=UPI000B3A7CF9|nr:ABC transporter ATP-binding protein [Olsenella sp. An285]OUO48693.1 ABC transporter [Olsenella sp. An285]
MNVIETHGLTKRYRRKLAVDNLDMTVAAGDIYGFVGKNGSGKSTTMKMICGLARPTAGEVVLFGDPEHGGATPQGFSRIGALIESPGVLQSLTARDNLVAKALALGMTHAGDVADDLLGLVGLDPADHRRVKAYSLGMKQRLGLALALVGGPDLLLLDEPFNGLDPEATRAMRLALVRLNHEHGVTIMISSHVLDQLDRVATRFGVIAEGRLTAEFTDEELHERCGSSVRVRLAVPERGLALLEQTLPQATFRADPDGALVITGATLDEVSAACFSAGIEVRELTQQERDIEEYFVELMGVQRGQAPLHGEKDGGVR